jgi:hypothetical protein
MFKKLREYVLPSKIEYGEQLRTRCGKNYQGEAINAMVQFREKYITDQKPFLQEVSKGMLIWSKVGIVMTLALFGLVFAGERSFDGICKSGDIFLKNSNPETTLAEFTNKTKEIATRIVLVVPEIALTNFAIGAVGGLISSVSDVRDDRLKNNIFIKELVNFDTKLISTLEILFKKNSEIKNLQSSEQINLLHSFINYIKGRIDDKGNVSICLGCPFYSGNDYFAFESSYLCSAQSFSSVGESCESFNPICDIENRHITKLIEGNFEFKYNDLIFQFTAEEIIKLRSLNLNY